MGTSLEVDLQQKWTRRFDRELRDARLEYKRLRALYSDVCWYNFEVVCSKWKEPWHVSFAYSPATLHGYRQTHSWRMGRYIEEDMYPIWYTGFVVDAPALPPKVLEADLEDAAAYVSQCEEQRDAAVDWAPGGHKYTEMMRYSNGVAMYEDLQRATKSDTKE